MRVLNRVSQKAGAIAATALLAMTAQFSNAAGTGEICQDEQFPYLTFDPKSGYQIMAHNENVPMQPGSMAKMMTLVILHKAGQEGLIDFNAKLQLSRKSIRSGAQDGGLTAAYDREIGPRLRYLTNGDAVQLIAIRSSNDLAVALAKDVMIAKGFDKANPHLTDHFVGLMNAYAAAIGMKDTRFTNVTGLPDERAVTTLKDLGILLKNINDEWPQVRTVLSQREFNSKRIYKTNMLTLMREESYAGFDVYGKTAGIDAIGAAGAASVTNDKGTQVMVLTACHEGGAENWQARHYASVKLLDESIYILENEAYSLLENPRIGQSETRIASQHVEICEDIWGNPARTKELCVSRPHSLPSEQALADSARPVIRQSAETLPQP